MSDEFMRLEWLKSFVAVAESRSYEAAAEKLRVAQPTVWKQVNNLSRTLDMPLFEKGTVLLTSRGAQLLSKARQLLGMNSEFYELANELRDGVTGVVRIACYPAHINHFLARAAGAYKRKYPNARIGLSEFSQAGTKGAEHLERLERGEVDLAVGPRSSAFQGVKIYTSRIVVVLPASHPRRSAATLGPEDLRGSPLLVAPPGYHSRTEIDRSFAAAGLIPKIETESSSWMALLALGGHEVGIPIVPDDALENFRGEAPYPAFLSAEGEPLVRDWWLQWRDRTELKGAVENFIQFVEQFMRTEDDQESIQSIPDWK